MKLLHSFFFSLILLAACSNADKQQSDCTYGEPRPIFSDTLEAIQTHQFSLTDQLGIENITFTTGLELEIQQSGCDAIRQEFQFTLKGNYTDEAATFWFEQAMLHFQFLGSLGEQYFPLYAWGQAIGEVSKDMKVGEAYEVQPHFNAIVDKVVSTDQATLIVTLAQQIED